MKIYKPMENASYEIIVINLQVSRATTITIKKWNAHERRTVCSK